MQLSTCKFGSTTTMQMYAQPPRSSLAHGLSCRRDNLTDQLVLSYCPDRFSGAQLGEVCRQEGLWPGFLRTLQVQEATRPLYHDCRPSKDMQECVLTLLVVEVDEGAGPLLLDDSQAGALQPGHPNDRMVQVPFLRDRRCDGRLL